MYGQRFEIVSDPFDEGDCIAVRATSGNDPVVRTLRLPIAILVSLASRFLKRPSLTGAPNLITQDDLPGTALTEGPVREGSPATTVL